MSHNIQYPVELIRTYIQEGKTQDWIAQTLVSSGYDSRITAKAIYKVCRKHGIKCQRTGPRAGDGHPEWQGGRHINKSGYIEVYCPDHPMVVEKNKKREAKSNGKYYRKEKYMLEHRLVMEKKIGRYLLPEEVVHHIDGNKQNNAPENLGLFLSSFFGTTQQLHTGKCKHISRKEPCHKGIPKPLKVWKQNKDGSCDDNKRTQGDSRGHLCLS